MRTVISLFLLVVATPAAAETVVGQARVIDGDTIAIGETTIRLFGIDAPEADQTCDREGAVWNCGEESAAQLRGLIGDAQVFCRGQGQDQYGRTVAVCSAGRFELNATMVEYGWATAFRQYSSDYVAQEMRARAARAGVWDSDFLLPEQYRIAQAPAPAEQPQRAQPQVRQNDSPDCVIKGNRSRRGEWIFHLPGMQYYEQTRAEEIFCSEADAIAAGYRRSRV